MGNFADMLEADVGHLLSVDEFGESIWYYPVDSPGTGLQITGVVHRHNRQEEAGSYRTLDTEKLTVTCRNTAGTGIANPKTGDAIRLATESVNTRWAFAECPNADPHLRVLTFIRTSTARAGERPRVR